MKALGDCRECGGYGVLMKECGKKCGACGGLGIALVEVSEDVFFANLPPGMSRDDAKALLRRIRLRREIAEMPTVNWWSPFQHGVDVVALERPEPTSVPGAGVQVHR